MNSRLLPKGLTLASYYVRVETSLADHQRPAHLLQDRRRTFATHPKSLDTMVPPAHERKSQGYLLRSFSRAVVPSSLPAVQGDPHGGQAEGNLLDSLFSYLWALCFQIKASEMQSLHCTVCGSEWGASKNTSFYLSPPFFPKEQHRTARR